jgi:ABC-type sugar transport system ATPase subunit
VSTDDAAPRPGPGAGTPHSAGDVVLEVDGIGKEFYGVPVLRDVSFALRRGAVLGLVGENGAGKSTLMNVLGGVLTPEAGEMRLRGAPFAPTGPRDAAARGIAFIHQELNVFPNLSITDNLFVTGYPRSRVRPLIARRQARQRTRELLTEVGLARHPDTLVELLPPGERQLVEIAKAVAGRAEVVIFDEPTTSLTARESTRLFALIGELTARGTAVVYISHILEDVARLADDVLVLRDGRVVAGGPAAEMPPSRMIAHMVGRSLESLYPDRTSQVREDVALSVRGVSQPGVVADVDLDVRRGEVVGVFGLMGAGRTELARIVFGLDPRAAGTVLVGGRAVPAGDPRAAVRAGMAFVTEDRRQEGLLMDFPVSDNILLATLRRFSRRWGGVDTRRARAAAEEVAGVLQLRSSGLHRQPVRSLSGGNQQKTVIAKWLLTEPTVFVLDEPTRGIDVGAKQEVYRVIDELAAGGAGVLVISSELPEVKGICDRVLVMRRGEVVGEFTPEGYDDEAVLRAAFGERPAPAAADGAVRAADARGER